MEEDGTKTNCVQSEVIESAEESSYETTQAGKDSSIDSKTPSTDCYPKTSSPSSVVLNNFTAEFALSTSTTDMVCSQAINSHSEVQESREVEDPHCPTQRITDTSHQSHVEKFDKHAAAKYLKNLLIEIPVRLRKQYESTTSSENTGRCKLAKKRGNKTRSIKGGAVERNLAKDDSQNTYPYSKSNRDYLLRDSIRSSIMPITEAEFSDSILDLEVEGVCRNIEHDIVATKYGLPYDEIECPCNDIKRPGPKNADTPISPKKNCYNFQNFYGKIDYKIFKHWGFTRRSEEFRRASSIYDILVKKVDTKMESAFKKSEIGMKLFYSHYWVHLIQKYVLNFDDCDLARERHGKKEVVKSCQRILEEQEVFARHYKVQMTDFGRKINFGEQSKDLNNNFEMACFFLKKEYPTLFQYLMKKFRFSNFVIKRMTIEKNRLEFIKRWRASHEKLSALDAKYQALKKKTNL